MPDFDYQWANLPSPFIEYNKERISEFLRHTGFRKKIFGGVAEIAGKICLDAGCGNGRYTYAMLKLEAQRVDSIDVSGEAIAKCKKINPNSLVQNLLDLIPNPIYDFVFSWGVLNHIENPREGFARISKQLKAGGRLHIMVYHRDTQAVYIEGRKLWSSLTHEERIAYCNKMIVKYKGNLHGWWDALNPTYNHSFYPEEIINWFKEEGFNNIKLISGVRGGENININAAR